MAPDESFVTSTRAVAPLIGFILLFGLFTVAFAGYQASSVPQQNAETEFQHYETVQNDLIVVRNAIIRAGDQDQAQFESVQLGTAYRERILALNPPDPAGTLRTSDPYEITVERDDTPVAASPISTRFLEYRNGYNELEIGSIYYENTVVYLDEGDDGGIAIIEEQDLVVDGTVRVSALQNAYQRSAVGRVSVELYPVEEADGFTEVPEGATVEIDLPTRLNGPEYWDDALGEFSGYEADPGVTPETNIPEVGIDENEYAEGIHRLNIEVEIDKLRFNTVGIDDAPESADTAKSIPSGETRRSSGFPLEYGSLERGDGGTLTFTATNVAEDPVTVTDFSADATAIRNNVRINNGDSREVSIEPDSGSMGELNQDGPGKGDNDRVNADGQVYPLDQKASINPGSDVTIDIRGWDAEFDLERVETEADADVIITLEYDSFDSQSFYFQDTS